MGTSGQGFSFDSPSQTKEKQLNLKTVYCMLPPLYKCVCTVSLQQDGLLDCFESDKIGLENLCENLWMFGSHCILRVS